MREVTNQHGASLVVMVVGSLPPPIGGTTVSLAELVRYLKAKGVQCIAVNTSRHHQGSFMSFIRSSLEIVRYGRNCDVISIHLSDHSAVIVGPLFWLLTRLVRRPVIYRQFGGSFGETFSQLPRWRQALLRATTLASNLVLLQTKGLVHAFDRGDGKVRWFPTARGRPKAAHSKQFTHVSSGTLRCAFIGHVRQSKGVLEAVEAVGQIDGVRLDIYGPLIDLRPQDIAAPRVQYFGTLDPQDVAQVMADHDLLLFPSYYKGEGYSGTLVEAALVGLPMIVSRWQSLPEMFSENEAWFVEPKDVGAIIAVIKSILARPEVLGTRSDALRLRSLDYDADRVFAGFIQHCAALARHSRHRAGA